MTLLAKKMNSITTMLVILFAGLVAGCEKKAIAPKASPPDEPSSVGKAVTREEFSRAIQDRREAAALESARAFPTRGAVFQPVPPSWYVGVRDDFTTLEASVGALGQAYAVIAQSEVLVSASVATRQIKVVATSKSLVAKRDAFDRALADAGVAISRIDDGTLVLSAVK